MDTVFCSFIIKAAPFVLPPAPWQPINVLVFTLGKKELAVGSTNRSLFPSARDLAVPSTVSAPPCGGLNHRDGHWTY